MTKKKIRIKDIAEKAGVSIGTVDRVLHNRGEVSKKTKAKIQAIIEEHGYQPDIMASTLASQKEYHVVVIIPSEINNHFWKLPHDGVNKAASEIKRYNTQITVLKFEQRNNDQYNEVLDTALSMNSSGVIVFPINTPKFGQFLNQLEKQEIPYLFINSDYSPRKRISYIGQDAYQSGITAGRFMSLTINTNNKVLVLNIARNIELHSHIKNRINGFTDMLKKKGITEDQIIHSFAENEDLDEIEIILKQNFTLYPEIKAIFVPNAKVYLVCRYLKKNFAPNEIIVMGYDATPHTIKYIENEYITLLICQRPIEQGYRSVMTLFNHAVLKNTVESTQYIPIDVITKENLSYYQLPRSY